MSATDPASEEMQYTDTKEHTRDELSDAEEFVSIDCLPDEILEYILSLTSPYCDFKSALQVSKRWYSVIKSMFPEFVFLYSLY